MKPRTLLVSLAALALAACKQTPETPAGVIPRDRFVAANVAVRLLPETATQAEREAALKKAGVTDRQMRAFVIAYARQPETLAQTWEQIAFRVDSVAGSRPLPGGTPPPGAGVPPGAVPPGAGVPPGAVPPPPAAGPIPVQLPINEDSVLRRDDSLRFRRPRPRPRPNPRQPIEAVRPKRGTQVQQ
ncbi:hypothetical protein [Longimicrobium sp.]|uniref:hypothetical protein n=1 Tax=Longimicrobium sp. TaxID=2029185 RepID=UPI002E366328|nr:hypothetical protein [Longimicrobium sp.]HEX6040078.1 hypothetical protein [Longimicrobium sp.]